MKQITMDYDEYEEELHLNRIVGGDCAIDEASDYLRDRLNREQFLDSDGAINNRKKFLEDLDYYYEDRKRDDVHGHKRGD